MSKIVLKALSVLTQHLFKIRAATRGLRLAAQEQEVYAREVGLIALFSKVGDTAYWLDVGLDGIHWKREVKIVVVSVAIGCLFDKEKTS